MNRTERKRSQRREQLRRARRRLDERQLTGEELDGHMRPRGEREWRGLVEQRIQDAIASGDFDNLPGKGQPLNLSRDPYLDPSLGLAYSLLKNNGYTPEWIARDKEIREELEAARACLRAAWTWRKANLSDESAWQAALVRFDETLTQLNRKIDDLNLIVPVPSCQRLRVKLADELNRMTHE